MKATKAAVVAVLLAPAVALSQGQPAPAAAPGAASAASAPAPQSAPVAASSVAATAPAKDTSGLHWGIDLDHSLGQGTFVDPSKYAYFDGSVLVVPSYGFDVQGIKLSASGRFAIGWEYTLPDNESARRFDWTDIRAGLSAPALVTEKVSGISVTPSVTATLPISVASRRANTITVLSGGLGFARTVWNFDLTYRFAAARGFHANPLIGGAVSDETDALGARLCLYRAGETTCNVFGTNTQFSISNSLEVTYRATEKLSFQLTYGIINRFKYPVVDTVDEYTPKALNSNGEPVATAGYGRSDGMISSVSASYTINDTFSISTGFATPPVGIPPKTKDGKRFRFPFYDFLTPADNVTSFSVTLSAAL
ncbi:MAG: hypothetical protein HYZ28_17915 [Myxococcales bacterium]|nr:hypothetical protein [Myxococcales bacterium]